MRKYNIIMITIDGARVDFLEKHQKRFSNFNNIINKGIFFNNMITYAPSTIASMYAIFSGTYGSETGVNNYWSSKAFKNSEYMTITEYLKKNGYFTVGDSINELTVPKMGFDYLSVHNEYTDDLKILHEGLIKKVAASDKPFFLYLHYSKIHALTTENVMDKYEGEYDENYYNSIRENKNNLLQYMQYADDYLGWIIEKLVKQNLFEDSIVIVLSDHGTGTGEKFGERRYGIYLYDYTLRCFLFLLNKKLFGARKINNQIRTIDIMPTIMELLGLDKESHLPDLGGKSLLPVVNDNEESERLAFSETATLDTPSRTEPNIGSIRTNRYKGIYNKITRTREFYDLVNDPEENNNLSGKGIDKEKMLWYLLKKMMNI